jgi:hypothetical protein
MKTIEIKKGGKNMKKLLYGSIVGIVCVMLIAGCGSKEKKNLVGSTGTSNVLTTSKAATVLTTDALDALKAVSSGKTASGSGPSGLQAPGLSLSQKLASPIFRTSTWTKPEKDADGYYIQKYTDPEDGTVFDIRVKPTPDWWDGWNDSQTMPWASLADGTDFTSTMNIKGSFTGTANSGTFTSLEKEIRKVKTYTYTMTGVDGNGQPVSETHTWKGLDWNNTIRTRDSEGTITKTDGTWVKMKSSGTSKQTDTGGWDTGGVMTMEESEIMTFSLSSGYSGKFTMKVAGTITHTAMWASQSQNVSGSIDGVLYLSGAETVKLHLEGKGKASGDGPDLSTIQG